jgi:outer membrane protein assembly factor BamB
MINVKRLFQVVLFFLAGCFSLFAQNEEAVLWKRAVGGEISTWQATGPDGVIYLVGDDRALHALNPHTGEDLWLYRPGGRLLPFLAVGPDGTIYIQNTDNEIYAVNHGGDARWKCSVSSPVQLMPVLTPEGMMIFLLENGLMAALSRKGEIIWTTQLEGTPTASPVIDYRGRVYLAVDQSVLCYNLDGDLKWSLGIPGVTRLAVDHQGRIFSLTDEGRIHSFNYGGDLLWDSGTEPGKVVTLALREKDVLIQTASGLIFVADGVGAESFYRGPEPLEGGYLTEEGKLCFFDTDNRLIALDFAKGEEEVLYTVPAVPSLPLITDNGLIFFGASDWRYYAIKGERPDKGWSQFRANPQRDGSLYNIQRPEFKEELYKGQSNWSYYIHFTKTNDPASQLNLIDEIRSYGDNRTLLEEDIPFWDLLMMKLTTTWDDRLYMVGDEGYRDNPVVRAEAFHLLGEWAVLPARYSIISQMKQEEDAMVLASACYALGEIASDWDGESTETIGYFIQNKRLLGSDRFSEEAGRALEKIMLYNGGDIAEACMDHYSTILESDFVSDEVKDRLLDFGDDD